MKTRYIILIALLAVLIGVIVGTYGDVSSKATFKQASNHPGEEFYITGDLMKDLPMEYDPEINPNYFTFHVRDKDNQVMKVVSHEPKMQDFELTDQVSMVGYVNEGVFRAVKIIPKCPSKYEEEQG